MWGLIISAGIMLGEFVYHRWLEHIGEPPVHPPRPSSLVLLPTSSEGATPPLFYGRIRVRSPWLAWAGAAQFFGGGTYSSDALFVYGCDMLFNVGIPFSDGSCRFVNIYAGELKLGLAAFSGSDPFAGDDPTAALVSDNSAVAPSSTFIGGLIQYYNGDESQVFIDGSDNAVNFAADAMKRLDGWDPHTIPSFRGFASIFLYANSDTPWIIGDKTQPDAMSFEMQTYPSGFGSGLIVNGEGVTEVNPMDVVYDLLTGRMGKLGLNGARIHAPSITACAATLAAEGHGMSRSWEDGGSAEQKLTEIMQQIDGTYYEDPADGLIHFKLIRPDYNPNDLLEINPSNCTTLDNFAAGGWTDVVNRVRVTFTKRAFDYRQGSALSQSQANAAGQDGEVRDITLDYPGITWQGLADQVADRELAARSKPLMKMRALISRDFYRHRIGDPVMVSWPEANISRIVFRIAAMSFGTFDDSQIAVDLIQDYFYQWRREMPVHGVGEGVHGLSH